MLLVGSGFVLASLFGPPDLADQLADRLTLGKPTDPWGDLRPAPAAVDNAQQWAYFAQTEVDRLQLAPSPLRPLNEMPNITPAPVDEPSWLSPTSPIIADTAPPTLDIAADEEALAWDNQSSAAVVSGESFQSEPPSGLIRVRDAAVLPAAAEAVVGSRYATPAPWPTPQPTPPTSPATMANTWPTAPPLAQQSPSAASPANQAPRNDWHSAAYRQSAPPVGAWEDAVRTNREAAAAPHTAMRDSNYAGASPLVSAPTPGNEQPIWTDIPMTNEAFNEPPAQSTHQGMIPASSFQAEAQSRQAAKNRSPQTHIVTDGDTLAKLAERYLGDASRAADLFAWNRSKIDHPDLLPIGVALQVCAPGELTESAGLAGGTAGGLISVGSPSGANPTAPRARLLTPRPEGLATSYPGR
ncbi:MAG: LysM domain-containing protein [Planctomycetota bacterium]